MGIVTAKCKWGHDTLLQAEGTLDLEGTKTISEDGLCPACLADKDPYVVANAGRLMHPDRYALWLSKAVSI